MISSERFLLRSIDHVVGHAYVQKGKHLANGQALDSDGATLYFFCRKDITVLLICVRHFRSDINLRSPTTAVSPTTPSIGLFSLWRRGIGFQRSYTEVRRDREETSTGST